jgi:hypothetical protein
MDDVDVHLLLFPYYICTAMGKKVMPENNNKTYRFWLAFPCIHTWKCKFINIRRCLPKHTNYFSKVR